MKTRLKIGECGDKEIIYTYEKPNWPSICYDKTGQWSYCCECGKLTEHYLVMDMDIKIIESEPSFGLLLCSKCYPKQLLTFFNFEIIPLIYYDVHIGYIYHRLREGNNTYWAWDTGKIITYE